MALQQKGFDGAGVRLASSSTRACGPFAVAASRTRASAIREPVKKTSVIDAESATASHVRARRGVAYVAPAHATAASVSVSAVPMPAKRVTHASATPTSTIAPSNILPALDALASARAGIVAAK